MQTTDQIRVRGACEHNLKNVSVVIPRDSLVVITGLSGSGKSSLAFDTIYAEGQRRYMESLSAYARQFVEQMHKPSVELIEGLSPAISIEQKTISRNPRSTVGTVTEIYDYLRVLYANIGQPFCPQCHRPIEKQTVDQMGEQILAWPGGTKFMVLAPVVRGRKGEYRQIFDDALRQGFVRARVDGKIIDLESPPTLKKSFKHDISIVIDRLMVSASSRGRLMEALELALQKAEGLAEVETVDDGKIHLFSQHFACPECGVSIEEITHRLFSFNSPYGWCPKCEGIGTKLEVDEEGIVPNPELSIAEGALVNWSAALAQEGADMRLKANSALEAMMKALSEKHGFSLTTPFRKLAKSIRDILLWGSKEVLELKLLSRAGKRYTLKYPWEGMIRRVRARFAEEDAQDLEQFLRELPCPECGGQRLRAAARAVRVGGRNISELCQLNIERALEFIESLEIAPRQRQIAAQLLHEVGSRLEFLKNVGVGYLTLDRHAGTLSGGEAQRIRLATQIGSQLTGVLYVLDEPSIGLHQRDNRRLIDSLMRLRDLGNTVIVVEHDESTIRSADYVVDMGPGAGRLGGEVVAAGTPEQIARSPQSATGRYLLGEDHIPIPRERRRLHPERRIIVRGAREHNLRDIDVEFPLGAFICVTGISGSGKSTLVNDVLFHALSNAVYTTGYKVGAHDRIEGLEQIDKVIEIDQAPIGRTPRSNPVTYTGVFTAIRDLFAQLPEAQIRGYKPGRFSFNVKGGRCEACMGDGMKKIEMHFLPEVYVECEICRGRRYNRETLEVHYNGKSIADVLEMTIEEACEFFSAVPSICGKMQTLREVGLGYITLGQSATTLSGGEAQRVKLSKELSRRSTGRTIYLMDEPTTGLHFDDVRKLLSVLQVLVDQGNTVVVIEHNLEVIKCADWIIDLGPEGGEHGGEVVAAGTPEQVARVQASHTGVFLADILSGESLAKSRG